MITAKRVIRLSICSAICLVIVTCIVQLNAGMKTVHADSDSRNIKSMLEMLVAENTTIAIVFREPVSQDSSGWVIPGDILDGNNIIGRRIVKEIGDDYLCVDEIGQGATLVYCLPYTNILYLTYSSS